MNHLSHDYQLPDDSFLYNLDVNDWSMLAHPEETDQLDDSRAKDQEVTDSPKPEQLDQEQQLEAESVQEITAAARQAKERVVAKVALAGQSAGEKGSVRSSQTGQDEPRVEVTKLQDTGPKESPAERLANDPVWQKQGYQASNKVWEKTLELQGFNKYGDYLLGDSRSKEAIDRERRDAVERANSAFTLADQLYSNPGWLSCELLSKEVLQRYTEESPDNARLVEALDAVYNLFNTTYHNNWTENMTISNDVTKVVCDSLDYNHNKFDVSVFCWNNHGIVGVAALYHLRKELRDDEPIKKILRIADSGSEAEVREILNDTDKSGDVADYERKLGLIDRMAERVDQYLDGAWSGWNCFTMHLDGGESNMLYDWLCVRSTERFVAGLSEDELRQRTEEYTDSDEIYSYIKQWDGKNLFEMADQIHDEDVRARECRKAESSRTA